MIRQYRGKRVDKMPVRGIKSKWVEGDLSVGSAEYGWDESKIFIIPRQPLFERIEVIPESVEIEVCGQWFSEEELSKIVKKGLTDDSN